MASPVLPKALPAVLWMALISGLSHGFVNSKAFVRGVSRATPAVVTEQGFSDFWSRWWWLFVKGWHVLEFFVLTLLVLRTGVRVRMAALIALCLAAVDEWHQTFIPKRGGLVSDVLIDSIGIVSAAILALALAKVASARQLHTVAQ